METKNKIEVYLNETLKEEQIIVPILDYVPNEEGNYQYGTQMYEQPNKIGILLLVFVGNISTVSPFTLKVPREKSISFLSY